MTRAPQLVERGRDGGGDELFAPVAQGSRRRCAPMCAARAIVRCLLGALLLATSIGKLLDNRGFAQALASYRLLPAWSLLPVGLCISLLELSLARWLLLGRKVRRGAIGATALHASFLFVSIVTLARGIELDNCGCFGAFWARPLSGWTVVEDLILTLLSLWLYHAESRRREQLGAQAPRS